MPFRSVLVGLVLSLACGCGATVVTDQTGSGGAGGLDAGGHDAATPRDGGTSASGCIGPLKGEAIPPPILCAWSLYFCTKDVPPPEPIRDHPEITGGCVNAVTQGPGVYNVDAYCCWE